MKQATLDILQVAARDGQCRLFYLDEAGICAAPPVQRSCSPRGLPHAIEPNSHCRRLIIGALDFGKNALIHASHTRTVHRRDPLLEAALFVPVILLVSYLVMRFIDTPVRSLLDSRFSQSTVKAVLDTTAPDTPV